MIELTTSSPFTVRSGNFLDADPRTPTLRRFSSATTATTSSSSGSLPELVFQSPLRKPVPRSNGSNSSPPPAPPPHALGTVQRGLTFRKPIYLHQKVHFWDPMTPVPDDFQLFGEIKDLIESYSHITCKEEENEKRDIWTDPLCSNAKFYERLRGDYYMQDEIIDQYYGSDFESEPSMVYSSSSECSLKENKKKSEQRSPERRSSEVSSRSRSVRASDPLPQREKIQLEERASFPGPQHETPQAPQRVWRSFSSDSPSYREEKELPETPSHKSEPHFKRVSFFGPSYANEAVDEHYIKQSFTKIGVEIERWVDNYGTGPRKISWGDLPLKAKQHFKRVAEISPDIPQRFQLSSESRAVLLRQMMAHLFIESIFNPILFGLSTGRSNFAAEYARQMGYDKSVDPIKYKEWESRFVKDETARDAYNVSLPKKVDGLRNILNYDLAPLLPSKSNVEGSVSSSANSQRAHDMHDIITRAVLLNVELKKRPELYEFVFCDHKEFRDEWMEADNALNRKISKAKPTHRVHAIVWPALTIREPGDHMGRVIVKAKAVIEPVNYRLFYKRSY